MSFKNTCESNHKATAQRFNVFDTDFTQNNIFNDPKPIFFGGTIISTLNRFLNNRAICSRQYSDFYKANHFYYLTAFEYIKEKFRYLNETIKILFGWMSKEGFIPRRRMFSTFMIHFMKSRLW